MQTSVILFTIFRILIFLVDQALRTSDDAPNPVFISVGHKISLDVTTQLVVACSHKRIPEPTRKVSIRVLMHYNNFKIY